MMSDTPNPYDRAAVENFRAVLSLFNTPTAAESLFLHLVPKRKFPPLNTFLLPDEVLLPIVTTVALQTLFPFKFEPKNSLAFPNAAAFHLYIVKMSTDRELVIKRQLQFVVSQSPTLTADLRLEYGFPIKLLERIKSSPYQDLNEISYFYHFLVDLVLQLYQNEDSIRIERDADGNNWLRIRNASPYRENGFFSDVTVLVSNIGNLVKVVFGEKDSDIETWYRYEWISLHLKEALLDGPLPNPTIYGREQTSVLSRILDKFTKFLAQ
jgi:hypothetical protein